MPRQSSRPPGLNGLHFAVDLTPWETPAGDSTNVLNAFPEARICIFIVHVDLVPRTQCGAKSTRAASETGDVYTTQCLLRRSSESQHRYSGLSTLLHVALRGSMPFGCRNLPTT